jgi:hypothetical protein
VLLASFAVLRLAVDALMATRQLQHAPPGPPLRL